MPVKRADSHTSGARFVSQPACLPEPLQKKDDTANITRFYTQLWFWPKPKNFMRTETLAEKRRTLLWKITFGTKKYFILTRTLAKKSDFYFYQSLCQKETSRFWKPCKTNHEQNRSHEPKPIKTKVDRNASEKPWSRFQRLGKTNLNLCQRRKYSQTKNAENLKTCVLKKILTKNFTLKSATAKNKLTLWIENCHAEEKIF